MLYIFVLGNIESGYKVLKKGLIFELFGQFFDFFGWFWTKLGPRGQASQDSLLES